MAVKFEVGTWTGNNTSPQTITLADSSLTPIAIIVTTIASGVPGSGFVANECLSMGFGTRRGGATQTGCIGMWNSDNVATTSTGRVRNNTLLHVLSASTTTDYTVSLDSFAAGSFQVSYSSAANANRDQFQYWVFGGADLTDANVLNYILDSSTTEVVSGVGFQPDVLFCLDADIATNATPTTNMGISFGAASSSSKFSTIAATADDGATMASAMNWNDDINASNCLARMTINADTQNALWDLNSFDSDGVTLGVNDAPAVTNESATFLFIKGGTWEVGQHNSINGSGDDVFTLANSSLVVRGVILFTVATTVAGISTAETTFTVGAGSTPNATRGSAVNNIVGIAGDEFISTHADRFRATDSVIELLSDDQVTTSEAYYKSAGTGTFTINWISATTGVMLINYVAIGDSPAAGATTRELAKMGVGQ